MWPLLTLVEVSQCALKVRWSVTWANIGVPSSDVPAEVDLLHMRIDVMGIPLSKHHHYRDNTIHREKGAHTLPGYRLTYASVACCVWKAIWVFIQHFPISRIISRYRELFPDIRNSIARYREIIPDIGKSFPDIGTSNFRYRDIWN